MIRDILSDLLLIEDDDEFLFYEENFGINEERLYYFELISRINIDEDI